MTSNERPALGDIKAGDLVYVPRSAQILKYHPDLVPYIPARIAKVARVWIDIKSVETRETIRGTMPAQTWRMRRDTQRESNGPNSHHENSFVTPEQRAWDERQKDALRFLHQQGIAVYRDSPWAGRRVELADLIRSTLTPESS